MTEAFWNQGKGDRRQLGRIASKRQGGFARAKGLAAHVQELLGCAVSHDPIGDAEHRALLARAHRLDRRAARQRTCAVRLVE